jgi:hypothetical protein
MALVEALHRRAAMAGVRVRWAAMGARLEGNRWGGGGGKKKNLGWVASCEDQGRGTVGS